MNLKGMYILLLLDGVHYKLSPSGLSFRACVSFGLLLDDLSIAESGMLKSPSIIVLLVISLFMSVST